MINKKVISLVLSLALIVSCFASLASLGVYAIDNTKKTTSLQTAPVVTTTTAEKKMAGTSAWTARTMSDPYPSTYPEWHCECGNVWADPSHNDDTSAPTSDLHYLWGSADKCKNEDGNGCDGTLLKWTPIGKTTDAPVVLGYENVYLTDDHSMQAQFSINTDTTPASFHVDLNGHTMYKNSGRPFRVAAAGGSLSVTDTSEAQTGKLWAKNLGNTQAAFLTGSYACKVDVYGGYVDIDVPAASAADKTYAPFATVKPGNMFSIYEGVTIDASGSELDQYTSATGVVEVQGDSTGGQGSLYMNGATIIGLQNTSGSGAGITLKAGGIVNAVNSTIKDGAAKTAGNIYVTSTSANCPVSTVKMTNCTIENGEATTGTGGNIIVGTSGNKVAVGLSSNERYVEFTNCTIDGGTAKTSGGNIYIAGASGILSSVFLIDCDVKNGTATSNDGGNINAGTYGRVFMNGGTIQNGTAGLRGGNVYVAGSGSRFDQFSADLTTSPKASNLIGGTAEKGGNVYSNGGTCNMKNATLTGGTATAGDGGVFFNYGAASTVDNCTITGGTATGLGDTVYIRPAQTFRNGTTITGECYFGTTGISGNRVMTLSGQVVMSDLIIGAPHTAQTNNTYFYNTLDVGGLTSGSDITVTVDYDENYLSFAGQDFADTTAALTRTFASDVTDDIAAYFSTTHTGYEFVNDNGSGHLAVYVPKHTHKIAANSVSAKAEGMGQEEVTYTAVTTEAELVDAIYAATASEPANIYLEKDIQLSEATSFTDSQNRIYYGLRIPNAGAVVNVCLNGHTLSSYDGGEDADTAASALFQFGAGTSSNYIKFSVCDCAKGDAKGGIVATRTVHGSSAIQYAGVGYVANQGRAYFYDINVTGSASRTAGFIRAATGYFEAYDTVFNNPATAHDAFVGTGANSAFKFYGCTMNVANESAVNMTAAVTNTGRATTLKNCTINSTANGDPAVKVLGLVTLDGTTITAADATPLELAGTATATITNSNLSSTNKVALIVPENTTANITGGTISSTNNNAFVVPAGATVNVTGGTAITSALDDADNTDATVKIQGAFNMTGGSISNTGTEFAFWATANTAVVNFTNVTFTTAHNRSGNIGTSGAHGSTVTLNNCTASVTDPTVDNGGFFYNYATLNINGGTYTGPDIDKSAGVLYNGHADAVANIYGDAVINGGNIGTTGAAIYNNAGATNIYGNATINGGTAGTHGGAIYNTGTLKVYGDAVVTGGEATKDGGNIYVTSSGTLQVYDNAVVSEGTAQRGGNIYNGGGDVTISGSAKIKDGTAYNAESYSGGQGGGGNIYSTSSGTFSIGEGVEISGGEASGNGGNIYNNATMTITGATVTGGTAGHNGGNIIFSSSTAAGTTVTDSSITNGHANRGGNIYSTNNTNVSLVGTTVSGGTIESNADSFGADVMIYANEEATPATIYGDANCTIGKVAMVYPFAQNNFAEGTYNPTIDYVTLNATKEDMVKSSTVTEKVAGENPDSAFNNWYLLARGQKKTDGSNWIRFTSLVDEGIEDYYAAGYFITIDGEETDMETHNVYKTNYENGVAKQIGDYSLSSDYYFHVDLEFSADDIAAGKTITIKPYLVDYNGNYYYGATKTASLAKLFPATVPVEGE